jgi:hypothetical protein
MKPSKHFKGDIVSISKGDVMKVKNSGRKKLSFG